jgi:3-dehydroquinate dehydratase/shikimate dehydrogenase
MTPPSVDGKELASLPAAVDWLEIRADLAGDLDANWLRSRFKGNLLYSLRSNAEGGAFNGSQSERRRRLLDNASRYDLVDLEGDRDLDPALLAQLPPQKRLISWHGPATSSLGLEKRLEKFSAVDAQIYKLVPASKQSGDEIAGLSVLSRTRRTDLIAYTEGKSSFWSRLVAPHLGMPMVFGTIDKHPGPACDPSVTQLIEDYQLPDLEPLREIYGIVGDPVQHSLSPRLHNAAYRALGYPALFVPFHAESFGDFWREVVEEGTLESLGITMRGFTVASPHKEAALGRASAASAMVKRAGSTNLFVRKNGTWKADTTDPEGVVQAMRQRGIALEGKKVAVVGCGGSGRAIAAALDQAGAKVTLVNRGLERGMRAIELLGLPFVPLSEFSVEGYSVIVNATPLGRDNGDSPFKLKSLNEDAVIVDLVYGSRTTSLIAGARAMGRTTIDGREVLFLQVRRQFHLMTGHEMPADLALKILDMKTPVRVRSSV